MVKHNQWRHGRQDFQFPQLPAEQLRSGCGFVELLLDEEIGAEVVLLFRDEAPRAQALANVQTMTPIAHSDVLEMPFGPIAYVVWQIAAGSAQEAFVETFLNPFQFGALNRPKSSVPSVATAIPLFYRE